MPEPRDPGDARCEGGTSLSETPARTIEPALDCSLERGQAAGVLVAALRGGAAHASSIDSTVQKAET